MKKLPLTSRVTRGLLAMSLAAGVFAYLLGMLPDVRSAAMEGRRSFSRKVAAFCSRMAHRDDLAAIEPALNLLVRENRSVASATVRRTDGSRLTSAGAHVETADEKNLDSRFRHPIFVRGEMWGWIEMRFRAHASQSILAWLTHPLVLLAAFLASASYLLHALYLRRVLPHLDPSRVVPEHLRDTLDTMHDGLLLLDNEEVIQLANRAFAERLALTSDELARCRVSDLPWESPETRIKVEGFPWSRVISEGEPQIGDLLTIRNKDDKLETLRVSAMPIVSSKGQQRGVLVSFDDVTQFEQTRTELHKMLDALSRSRDEIQRQNVKLERLATRDPLTGCLNRRSFFGEAESFWSAANRHQFPLSCIMVDLDRFKAINDEHGHQVGDEVLKQVAEILGTDRRPSDLLCRYGGEEFCLLLPHTDVAGACHIAEQLRQLIETHDFDGLRVTGSFGLAARTTDSRDLHELIGQADQCLYLAKSQGRNRVVRFDRVEEKLDELKSSQNGSLSAAVTQEDPAVPFHVVQALRSALAYRDQTTAAHSQRVADLSVATGSQVMAATELYRLEIAALLHDIGKIGVPDAILLKPGALTDDEWQVMNTHERIGVEIIRSTFESDSLCEIIRDYHAWYAGNPDDSDLPTGEDISLSARILAIADAYDSMTTASNYREALTPERAFAELRRCANQQFDPELVERFVRTVRDQARNESSPEQRHSHDAARSLSVQIEGLSEALAKRDLPGLAALARRLNMTAVKFNATDVANSALELEEAARHDRDLTEVLRRTSDLVALCRTAQSGYLNEANHSLAGRSN